MKILIAILVLTFISPAFAADQKESAYDRVMRTGTLRCAYIVYAPYFEKDPATGKSSGIFFDILEGIGKNSGLKVEWVEEAGYENIFAGLNADRYDAFCAGLWPNTERAKSGLFTIPVFYSVVTAWGRADEVRFSQSLSAINKPDIKIATIDGAQEDIIARTDYPLAQRLSSPTLSPFTDNYLKIASGKADVTFAEPSGALAYIAANPGSLKQISPEPLRIFGNALVVGKNDMELKEFLNQGLQELLYSGAIDKIINNHEKYSGSFMRVAKPYEKAP